MPIDYELYEKDRPAFACREHRRRPQVDDYWPFDDGEDMPPYDGPYELYEDGYPQIGFGRVDPDAEMQPNRQAKPLGQR